MINCIKRYMAVFALFFAVSAYAQGPIILPSPPYESNIDSTSLTISWKTALNGTSRVQYGLTTNYDLGEVNDTTLTKDHSLRLTGLQPATIYNVQFSSTNSYGTSSSGNYVVSTSSAYGSTGQMNVYFNKSVNAGVAIGEIAQGNVDLRWKMVARINAAKYSIDAALYSLSLSDVADALIDAKNRGVKVRVIDDLKDHGSESSQFQSLRTAGIPVLRAGNAGIMHNKFFVFDYRDKSSAGDDWVWTGSHNPTGEGSFWDIQNVIEIQDEALAGAFTAEFNEMWGGDGDTPNPANAKFGNNKTNNTPHVFNIRGVPVRLFFSPTDGISTQIVNLLGTATRSISFAMLIFTRSEIAVEMKRAHDQRGVKVHGVMEKDDVSSSSSQWSFLTSQPKWADVVMDNSSSSLMHHKYLIVDADAAGSEPWMETGSYNWTSSAETQNDESAIFVQSARVANLYLQEFTQRYYDFGGLDAVHELMDVPKTFALLQNYPNPFNPTTNVEFRISNSGFVSLKVFDVLGREVANLVNEEKGPGNYRIIFDIRRSTFDILSSGVYFYRLTVAKTPLSDGEQSQSQTKAMMVVR